MTNYPTAASYRVAFVLVGTLAFSTLHGCSGRTPAAQTSTPIGEVGIARVTAVHAPSIGVGVEVVDSSCQQGASELCNGLDDNCNGQIDEGCGYSSGSIQITLAWTAGVDLDLHVTDPNGDTLYYGEPRIRSGGFLDHDATGACFAGHPNNQIENAYWSSPNPLEGNYKIEVHHYRDCGAGESPVEATVSIAVGGQVWRALQATLVPHQRLEVATFSL